jgi:hypothetical protein
VSTSLTETLLASDVGLVFDLRSSKQNDNAGTRSLRNDVKIDLNVHTLEDNYIKTKVFGKRPRGGDHRSKICTC